MKNVSLLTTLVIISLGLTINGCCEPKVVIQKEYIKCVPPKVYDLNYSNDTNYTVPDIEYDIIEKDINAS